MPLTQRAEVLNGILDYITQTSVYSFAIADAEEFDQSYTFTGATIAIQGRDYGYDPLLTNAAPVAPRKTSWMFKHKYAVGETYDTLKDGMTLAFGHGRPVWLQKTRPDGTVLIAEARCDGIPDRAPAETQFRCEFTITFTQRGDWMSKDVPRPRYDAGYHYDAGNHYDQIGLSFSATGGVTNFTLTNNGTINERDGVYKIVGPMTAPITVVNTSCDARGVPFPIGVSGTPMYFSIFTSLASTEFIQIANKSGAITSNKAGLVPWSVVTKGLGQKSYFEVVPGTNNCQIQKNDVASAGSLFVTIRDRYRS